MKTKGLQTTAIHGGEPADATTRAATPNIVMSSSYVVDAPVSFSVSNADENTPYIYSRWANPTVRQLETKLALLENAEQCIAVASGMAASAAVLYTLRAGEHLVISNTNYPGTAEISRTLLPEHGVAVTPVDSSEPAALAQAMRAETKMIWIETPSNPLLRLTDIEAAAKLAHAHGAILVVDSTFASPIAMRPLELGADLVVHSLTKYIGGHGDALGGAILGKTEMLARLRAAGIMHLGGVISPFNAWLIMRGAATLPIRMQTHQHNALIVAEFLQQHPAVEQVRYPGLASHPQHALATRQMQNYSGMIAFRVARPHATAAVMMQKLEVIHYAVSLGHHRSLIFLMDTEDLIKSSYQLQGAELEKYRAIAGDGIFRLSIGLENAEDLIDDLARVL